MDDIRSTIRNAETRWPQLRFKKKTNGEASASCPFCNNGIDRFVLFADGGYWCRQCESKGWIDEEDSQWSKLTDTERRLRVLEAEQRRARREREEQAQRLSALERMAQCQDHLRYHEALSWDAIDYWHGEGMTTDTIGNYKLGFCERCPTDREGRPSYTIPVTYKGKLINIRHRLVDAPSGDKYRPHMAGLGAQLFNADAVHQDLPSLVIVEGEKKSIICEQTGIANVGIIGKQGFKPAWAKWFGELDTVYVALDPDAKRQAWELARLFNGTGRVARLPCKIDDMIVKYGATKNDIEWYLNLARPVKGRGNGA
jgi:hypothetical protein